ncbi:T-cell surface glycoprotein CD5 [Phaenicophaeus curvirostris]|uniref:T-cell surface glycoprotein CD5 n=1 Tax=Phaenicophaeus curvirostris TaxID=33595 RepID=UPI0037F0B8F2
MAASQPPLHLLLALGMWAIPVHGGAVPSPGEPTLRLIGGGCRCTGILEVMRDGKWSRVCRDSVGKASAESICHQLGCGPTTTEPLRFFSTVGKEPRVQSLRCSWPAAQPVGCRWLPANCTEHVFLSCHEPVKSSPEPTSPAPVTTPEPPGPPRLLLVDGDSFCSGFVELHAWGLWGAVASSPALRPEVATSICQVLRCGTAIRGHAVPEPISHSPVRWEVVEPCDSLWLLDCFNRSDARRGAAPAFITCSGSQPQAQRRLADGPTPCEGDVEIFHEGWWRVLCDNRLWRAEWGRQLCRELRCGNLSSSAEIRDPPSRGVTCTVPNLHLCPANLKHLPTCSRTRIVCQDSEPHPVGPAAGTIVSICLALLLLGVLALICGPPAYRKVMKRISKKKQRQWIGPTGLNQTVSFHRNSTVTPRSRSEAQRVQGGDNDYAQAPQRSSQLSAYPALEGRCRPSHPADNSSESDYDLYSASRV